MNKEGQTVDVDDGNGAKKMRDVDMPSESPQKKDAEPGQGQDGQDKDGEGKTAEELAEEQKGREGKDGQDKDGQEQDGDGQKGKKGQKGEKGKKGEKGEKSEDGEASDQAGEGGEGRSLEEIAKQDWTNYPAIVAQLLGPINQVERILRKIQERQLETEQRRSRDLEKLPEGHDMGRLDRGAHRNLILKQATGQAIEDQDLDRFDKDKPFKKPTKLDVAILIDGSGSMESGGGKLTPIQSALLGATILFEGSKRRGFNNYMMLWGNNDPPFLAKPGDDPKTIGENILKSKKGLNSGTDLAPAIKKLTGEMAVNRKGAAPYTGYTHVIILSDGEIFDKDVAMEAINTLMTSSKYITMDFVILKKGNSETEMEKLAQEVKKGRPHQKIGVIAENDGTRMAALILGLILEKIAGGESFTAVPSEQKRKSFRRASARMPEKKVSHYDYM